MFESFIYKLILDLALDYDFEVVIVSHSFPDDPGSHSYHCSCTRSIYVIPESLLEMKILHPHPRLTGVDAQQSEISKLSR